MPFAACPKSLYRETQTDAKTETEAETEMKMYLLPRQSVPSGRRTTAAARPSQSPCQALSSCLLSGAAVDGEQLRILSFHRIFITFIFVFDLYPFFLLSTRRWSRDTVRKGSMYSSAPALAFETTGVRGHEPFSLLRGEYVVRTGRNIHKKQVDGQTATP